MVDLWYIKTRPCMPPQKNVVENVIGSSDKSNLTHKFHDFVIGDYIDYHEDLAGWVFRTSIFVKTIAVEIK